MQDGTTSGEFVEWCTFLEDEVNDFHREDYYLAQVAAEVRRGYVKDPQKVKVEDFVLKFEAAKDQKEKKTTPQDSKRFWLGSLGLEVPDEG